MGIRIRNRSRYRTDEVLLFIRTAIQEAGGDPTKPWRVTVGDTATESAVSTAKRNSREWSIDLPAPVDLDGKAAGAMSGDQLDDAGEAAMRAVSYCCGSQDNERQRSAWAVRLNLSVAK